MKLVLTGDIHLGRSSTRISDTLNKRQLRSASAWLRTVELAISENADVVCLSGDIADESNKFWESIGPLKEGISRLTYSGIKTVAVAGNHDYDVLPGLADQLPSDHFKLLGRNGKWERCKIELKNGEVLNIDGWSFPRKDVFQSPLNTYSLTEEMGIPTLGMLHGDLNAPSSSYAPLNLTSLQALGSGNWLLGHIHSPRLIQESSWILYPGSPQALDPGEPGVHGPWILEVQNGKIGLPVHYPLSTVWYEKTGIDLSGVSCEKELKSTIVSGIQLRSEQILKEAGSNLEHILLRLKLSGNTDISSRVNTVLDTLIQDLRFPVDSAYVTVEKIENNTLPVVNLQELAQTSTAAGAVARLLLDLQNSETPQHVKRLIQTTASKLEQLEKPGYYRLLSSDPDALESARKYLLQSGKDLLTELVSQRHGK